MTVHPWRSELGEIRDRDDGWWWSNGFQWLNACWIVLKTGNGTYPFHPISTVRIDDFPCKPAWSPAFFRGFPIAYPSAHCDVWWTSTWGRTSTGRRFFVLGQRQQWTRQTTLEKSWRMDCPCLGEGWIWELTGGAQCAVFMTDRLVKGWQKPFMFTWLRNAENIRV